MGTLVFVRVRTTASKDSAACVSCPAGNKVVSKDRTQRDSEEFEFDRVFAQGATQDHVFEAVQPIVHAVLEDGYNGTIMAYGQTSAGKTYTMMGGIKKEQRGIVPRVAAAILARVQKDCAAHPPGPDECSYQLSASALEVYNEKVRDLLDPSSDNLQVFQDAQGVQIPGIKSLPVRNEEGCVKLVNKALAHRSTSATNMNDSSSRSHCAVILTVEKTWEDGRKQRSKLCLVDLAGSERQSKTGAQGMTLTEGQNINKSLLVLGSVVNALNDGGAKATGRIPYRDSKLTRLLQDSLGGTAKTCIVVCCSPDPSNAAETQSSLRFGARARAIASKAVQNVVVAAPKPAFKADAASALQTKTCVAQKQEEGGIDGTAAAEGGPPARPQSLQMAIWAVATAAQLVGVLAFFAADQVCVAA